MAKILSNLWQRIRSPRPNRASGGYFLTGTTNTTTTLSNNSNYWGNVDTPASNVSTVHSNLRTSTPALPAYPSSSDECIINVTLASEDKDNTDTRTCTFELPKPATIITTTCVTDSEGDEEDSEGEPKKSIRRFKEYFSTNFGSQTTDTTTASTFQLIPQTSTTTTIAGVATTPPAVAISSTSSLAAANTTRMIAPRYRFRDLLLGDFSFNDDGESMTLAYVKALRFKLKASIFLGYI
ncbi:hypothetical protein CVS40_3080 [Lucilia cuprina]|nr:hypothetical protein CVS40_3080 [Lucilia cuprina]